MQYGIAYGEPSDFRKANMKLPYLSVTVLNRVQVALAVKTYEVTHTNLSELIRLELTTLIRKNITALVIYEAL